MAERWEAAIRSIAGWQDDPVPATQILVHADAAPDGEIAKLLHVLISDYAPALIIIDPLQLLLRVDDLSDYAKVSCRMAIINDIARSSDAHILSTHHANKMDTGEEGSILGSTALFGAVDTALLMKRRNDVRSLKSVQRYSTNIDVAIRLDQTSGNVTLAGEIAALQLSEAVARSFALLAMRRSPRTTFATALPSTARVCLPHSAKP